MKKTVYYFLRNWDGTPKVKIGAEAHFLASPLTTNIVQLSTNPGKSLHARVVLGLGQSLHIYRNVASISLKTHEKSANIKKSWDIILHSMLTRWRELNPVWFFLASGLIVLLLLFCSWSLPKFKFLANLFLVPWAHTFTYPHADVDFYDFFLLWKLGTRNYLNIIVW